MMAMTTSSSIRVNALTGSPRSLRADLENPGPGFLILILFLFLLSSSARREEEEKNEDEDENEPPDNAFEHPLTTARSNSRFTFHASPTTATAVPDRSAGRRPRPCR